MVEVSNENEEEMGEKRRREGEKEENETKTIKKEDVRVLFLRKPLNFLVKGDICRVVVIFLGKTSWTTEDLSDLESEAWVVVPEVPDVTDVPVSPSSVVTEFCVGFSFCSDWDFVEPQSFSFSKKRVHSCTVTQEEMWFEEPQVKAPPIIKKKNEAPYAAAKLVLRHVKRSRRISKWKTRCGVPKTERSLQRQSSTWKKVKV